MSTVLKTETYPGLGVEEKDATEQNNNVNMMVKTKSVYISNKHQ